jgi:hypothetical protein
MEPENIGIGGLLEDVHFKPGKYARRHIAPKVLDLLKEETIQQSEGKPVSIKNDVVVAEQNPTKNQIKKVAPTVIEILKKHRQ